MKRRQQGAALATTLLILTVLTLLGLAAMRGSRLELKLAQNAESRVNAQRKVYALLADELKGPIHALSLKILKTTEVV